MSTMRQRWRVLLAVDLGMFNVALLLFALLPPYNIIAQEWVAIFASAIAFFGVVSHASVRITLPGDRWAYMVTLCVALYVLVAFEFSSAHLPTYMRVSVGAFILQGAASAYAAHVIDGAKSTLDVDG